MGGLFSYNGLILSKLGMILLSVIHAQEPAEANRFLTDESG